MNLHQIASGAIGTINPFVKVTVQVSTGSIVNADGSRSPAYATPVTVLAQVQPLQYTDIVMIEGLNIQGVRRKMYLNGEIDGLVRSSNKGGDIITMPDGTIYKVAMIAEQWPDWVSAIVTLQDNA